jgi:hypothetical protein
MVRRLSVAQAAHWAVDDDELDAVLALTSDLWRDMGNAEGRLVKELQQPVYDLSLDPATALPLIAVLGDGPAVLTAAVR